MELSLGMVLLLLGLIIIILIALAAIVFLVWLVWDLIKSIKTTIEVDSSKSGINPPDALAAYFGKTGETITDLTPKGVVHVDGEYWKALSIDGKKILKESQISVIEAQGMVLKVRKI